MYRISTDFFIFRNLGERKVIKLELTHSSFNTLGEHFSIKEKEKRDIFFLLQREFLFSHKITQKRRSNKRKKIERVKNIFQNVIERYFPGPLTCIETKMKEMRIVEMILARYAFGMMSVTTKSTAILIKRMIKMRIQKSPMLLLLSSD